MKKLFLSLLLASCFLPPASSFAGGQGQCVGNLCSKPQRHFTPDRLAWENLSPWQRVTRTYEEVNETLPAQIAHGFVKYTLGLPATISSAATTWYVNQWCDLGYLCDFTMRGMGDLTPGEREGVATAGIVGDTLLVVVPGASRVWSYSSTARMNAAIAAEAALEETAVAPGAISRPPSVQNVAKQRMEASQLRDQNPFLFRGERPSVRPEQVFKEGFKAHGQGMDLADHSQNIGRSAYISTTRNQHVARFFATNKGARSRGFVYQIAQDPRGIDLNAALGFKSVYPEQAEVAFPGSINPSQIRGAWEIEGGAYKNFVNNPNYREVGDVNFLSEH